eukprot:SAG31_NODE_14559_length_799_cov_1.017143_1_plen_140_part_01
MPRGKYRNRAEEFGKVSGVHEYDGIRPSTDMSSVASQYSDLTTAVSCLSTASDACSHMTAADRRRIPTQQAHFVPGLSDQSDETFEKAWQRALSVSPTALLVGSHDESGSPHDQRDTSRRTLQTHYGPARTMSPHSEPLH